MALKELDPRIPKTLYKYREIDDYTKDIFLKKEIYFTTPNSFNDPFDCSIPIRYDLMTEEDHTNFAADFIKIRYPEKSYEDIIKDVIKLKEEGFFRTTVNIDLMVNEQLKKLGSDLGVFCLSAKFDDILMWSHYSNKHTGICIGFNTSIIHENTGAGIGGITYLDDYPTIKFSGASNIEDLIVQVLSKSKKWEYEEEFRFTRFEGGKAKIKIVSEAIERVYFGCEIDDNLKIEFIDMIKSDDSFKHVQLLQAVKSENKFSLNFNKI